MCSSPRGLTELDVGCVPEPLGESEAFIEFQEQVSGLARVDRPVLIVGERGTGKELAARRLHYLSSRWNEPLVTLNCAALAPGLIESELFGHEAGAFTGAAARRVGRFEMADRGTLFLDEIANVPVEVQEKVLRVVEYGTFERVGGSESVSVDARIIGATNADLPALAREGSFKQDLLDRLSFEVLFVPPLRARGDDIMLLAVHFGARMAAELGLAGTPEFTDEATEALRRHSWPGNVRELKNVVERAVYRAGSMVVARIDFDPFRTLEFPPDAAPGEPGEATGVPSGTEPAVSLRDAVRELEVRLLREALERSKHNQRRAAEALGLTYHQFRGLYRKHAGAL
jgi:psp operon transcriptional activator